MCEFGFLRQSASWHGLSIDTLEIIFCFLFFLEYMSARYGSEYEIHFHIGWHAVGGLHSNLVRNVLTDLDLAFGSVNISWIIQLS